MIERQAIFVFGMVRSGTSALSRVLSLCGAALPEQLLGPNEGNPRGHWEPLEALHLNEKFLFSNGSTYYDPTLRLQEELVVGETEKDAFIEKIAAFLDSCRLDRPVVLKEPRIVALSDLWFEAARRSGFDVKIVIPVRHPAEVAGSLAKRDQASFELSSALWLKYNLLAEGRSRSFARVFVEYPNLLADWRREVGRISEALSVRLDDRNEEAIGEFLTYDLHRQRSSDAPTEAFGSPWIGQVYAEFSAAARGRDVDAGRLDEIFAAYNASERLFRVARNEFLNRFSGYHWASDLPALLGRVVEECGAEIARRFGDELEVKGAPVDAIRAEFYKQTDHVSEALNLLAQQAARLQETSAKLAAQESQLQQARSYAETLGSQFLDANAMLLAYADLVNTRAVAQAHASTEEWLERRARSLEAELEAQRRSSQDREEALTRDLTRAESQLAEAHARMRDLQNALASSGEERARSDAAHDSMAGLSRS